VTERRLRRAIAATLAPWLVMISIEPGSLNACVLHGKGHVSGAHTAHPIGTSSATQSRDAHAQPSPNADAGHSPHDDSRPAGDAQCTCLGDCCGTLPLGTVAVDWRAIVPARQLPPPVIASDSDRTDFEEPAFTRPFPIGPPIRLV